MANAKSGIASISEGRSDIHKIKPTDLHIREGWNSRDWNFDPNDDQDLALARSIAEMGVKEPLTVNWEDGKAWIEDGHRRYMAVWYAINNLKADIQTVPVKTGDRHANEADRVLSQIIRNSGKPLMPIEQAKVYKKLIDFGMPNKDIAAKVGVSPARISQVLDLLTLPEAIKSLVSAGTVSASYAMQMHKEEGKEAVGILNKAVEVANAEGSKKVLPKHVEKPNVEQEAKDSGWKAPVASENSLQDWTKVIVKPITPAPGQQKLGTKDVELINPVKLKAILKDAFECSDVDNSNENDDDLVHIRMPIAEFEKIRNILGL